MPAFTFEKISNSKRLPAKSKPASTIKRRGIVASVLDRLTMARSRKTGRNYVRFECSASEADKS